MLPFLYNTRTLQRAWKTPFKLAVFRISQPNHATQIRSYKSTKGGDDQAVPFDFGSDGPPKDLYKIGGNDYRNNGPIKRETTITPNEAEIFKSIFDDIAQGKTPLPKEHTGVTRTTKSLIGEDRSILEQARMFDFQTKILSRFPDDLREAAYLALGLYEQKSTGELLDVGEEAEEARARRLKFEKLRAEEKLRVDELMKSCSTDFELWRVMEQEVFSLPQKLGIVQEISATKKPTNKKRTAKRKKENSEEKFEEAKNNDAVEDADIKKETMDIHGPLYSTYLSQAVSSFANDFGRPSPLAFEILPRVKSLGVASYVLGISTAFYATLARMHWEKFGDMTAALDVIREMNHTGLYANDDVRDLLAMMRENVFGCREGVQGDYVQHIINLPPYYMLDKRLEKYEKIAMGQSGKDHAT